ncbi:MAG TPA: DNA translocase FtsK 4TM domain-containing protein, partial [Candidatus Glassbacteria bacterium]|nr:DNA translocase FtsK 4TM domain-containing protein [Candidatus Glassbacteria bacterium]
MPPGKRSSSEKKEEVLGILLVAIGLLVGLSLLPQALLRLIGQATEGGYQNLVGLAGKFVNESAKDLIGVLAYALPVVVAAWGVRLFSGKPSPRYLRLTATALVLGLAAVVLIGLAAGPGAESIDWGAGRLGGLCARSLATGLGLAGSYVVTVVALLVFLIFFTGISIRPLVGVVAAAALAGVSAVSWLARKAAGLIKPRGPKRRKKPVAVSEAEDHPGPAGPEEIPEVEEGEP